MQSAERNTARLSMYASAVPFVRFPLTIAQVSSEQRLAVILFSHLKLEPHVGHVMDHTACPEQSQMTYSHPSEKGWRLALTLTNWSDIGQIDSFFRISTPSPRATRP